MEKILVRVCLCFILASVPLVGGCGGGGDDGGGHDVNKGGVMHKAGLEDPLRNCVECHGATLKGGRGPSCYSCHSVPANHTAVRRGVRHNPSADRRVCMACHGPNNTGGLGPACSKCHR